MPAFAAAVFAAAARQEFDNRDRRFYYGSGFSKGNSTTGV